ncbi:hypothetical protein TWF192_003218 [Orbilia oligospora]|nr:hypothetical protein TWF192_003218 [Orbilia oligospora]
MGAALAAAIIPASATSDAAILVIALTASSGVTIGNLALGTIALVIVTERVNHKGLVASRVAAGAERRRLMRFEATFEEFCQGETLTNPPHNPIRRQESPPPDYYRDLGFSRDVPRSEPREIIYPPGRRHHLSRDYNSLQDPNPGPFGVSYNEPRDVHRFDPENRRPSTSGFESDWDPWPEHQRQMRGERRYD